MTHGKTSLAKVVVKIQVGDTSTSKPLRLSDRSVNGVDDGEESHPKRHELRKEER